MKTKQIIGLAVAGILFIAIGVTSVLTNSLSQRLLDQSVGSMLTGNLEFNAPMSDYIAVVKVEGTIQQQTEAASLFAITEGYQHTTTMEYIDRLMEDSNNKGILLYVDSPGGTVYESEELYLKLMEYKETTGRPIWDYMSHYAASGGYMTSVAADKIYANPNTVTGSIGVIMSGYDMTGLYEKLGIRWWKDKVPDMSRILPRVMLPKRLSWGDQPERIALMIQEACIAELIHMILFVLGFGCVLIWAEGPGGWIVAMVYNLLGNVPFILIQRYNRPRLRHLMETMAAAAAREEEAPCAC